LETGFSEGDEVISHQAVLLEEAINQLSIRKDGLYVDGTFGRGGHCGEILKHLAPEGRLLAIDRDPEAVKVGESLASHDARFLIEHESFGLLRSFLKKHGVFGKVNGILLDLGVSSPQLEDARRGFSFQLDGPLDMRMNPDDSQSAGEWLNSAGEKEIAQVLFRFGEERASRRIARAIVTRRAERPLESTVELAHLIESVVPRRPGSKHPATQTFQAIRIFINRELDELRNALSEAVDALAVGGRLCVISFHSLEDRIVKRFLRDNSRVDPALARLPVVPKSAEPRLRLPAKAIRASASEIDKNPRARSATLRVGERLP
jgi:16S rRNA (cytosine1402-N4)-methyltransferase